VTVPWTRATLETQVTVLAARHEGQAFLGAISELAGTLTDEERTLLQEVLLKAAKKEGARVFPSERQIEEPRRRLFRRRPDEPGQR
jgi:hypothetical protein